MKYGNYTMTYNTGCGGKDIFKENLTRHSWERIASFHLRLYHSWDKIMSSHCT